LNIVNYDIVIKYFDMIDDFNNLNSQFFL